MKRLVGISTLDLQELYGDRRAIEIAGEIGADSIDFFLSHEPFFEGSVYNQDDEAVSEYYRGLKAYADECGVIISQTHGRCRFSGDEEKNATEAEKCRLDCLATAALGAPACVVHSVTFGSVSEDDDPQYIRDLNHRMYMTVLPFAKRYGVKIAAETLANSGNRIDFFGDLDELVRSVERVEDSEYSDCLTVCVDTGHSHKAVRYGFPPVDDVIRRLGKRVTLLHLHDNNGIKDQHKMPLSGSIEWDKVLDALDEIGYRGVYNMEISLRRYGKELAADHAAFAVKVMRNMLDKRYG